MGAGAGGQQAEPNSITQPANVGLRGSEPVYTCYFLQCMLTDLPLQTFALLQLIKVLLPPSGQNRCSVEKILHAQNNKAVNHFHSLVHSVYIHSSCYTWYDSTIGKWHCSTYIRKRWLMLAITWSTVISLFSRGTCTGPGVFSSSLIFFFSSLLLWFNQ